jgi:peroxiredoxin
LIDLTPLLPSNPTPPLCAPLAGGGTFRLADELPAAFTLVVFYRGLHCPICRTQLQALESLLPDFARRGVGVVAVSSDSLARAERTKAEWGLSALRIGAELPLRLARRWGLYVSRGGRTTSAGIQEPAFFSEPGLFLVRPDGTLYFGSTQTMPFTRPPLREVLAAVDYVLGHDYPARGEVAAVEDALSEVA